MLFLIWTAYKLAKDDDLDESQYDEPRIVRFARRPVPRRRPDWNGVKLFVHENGTRLITPMFIVVLSSASTDLLFALDSIPAIYGLTEEPYLVFTANVFALMGLRQLYFLIGDLLKRLVYLSYGLAVLLAFIGVKLILHAMHENELPFVNGGEPIGWAPGHPDLALARGHRRHPGRDHGPEPGQGRAGPRAAGNSTGPSTWLRCGELATSLSVLDLVPVRTDQATADAVAATLSLARTADELGYQRYWLAEHHNMPAVAATNPPVLIGLVAVGHRTDPGGLGRRDAAQPRPAGGGRAVRAARGGLPGPDRPRASAARPAPTRSRRFALRHGAGGVTDEAVTRFPEYVDNVLAMMEPEGSG